MALAGRIDLPFCASARNGIQYAVKPPVYERCRIAMYAKPPIKEWGEPFSDEEEECTLENLEEFDHGPLHRLLAEDSSRVDGWPSTDAVGQRTRYTLVEHPSDPSAHTGKRKRESRLSSPLGHKRPRLEEGSLFSALPHPHYCPALMTFDDLTPPLEFMNTDFRPRQPKPIPPHTHTTVEECIGDTFSRLAWIVPVRGQLPWETATPASIMANPVDESSSGDPVQVPEPFHNNSLSSIIWTRDALIAFWNFLKDVQDAGRLGPLSLAFYSPTASRESSHAVPSPYFGSHQQESPAGHDAVQPQSALTLEAPRSALCEIDYIKIYHDAKYTKILRRLLDAWSYKKPGISIRLLKAATLVLLDERSTGLLLC
ncbi:hypothetical protein BC628DRAFT_92535 [Trametes gibbosa]|nr:hypothetical protein BC628DRAFT_680462 [Trametes gibbosa]KAI0828132.1 hypothetical protein BC628DRAFT_92535 [Trametes gibbosa]